MNQRLVSVLAFALIVSAAASLLLYRLLAGKIGSHPASPSVRAVVAVRALEPGTLIRDPDVKATEWTGTVPPGAVQKKEDVIGRGVVFPIVANEPIVESRLAPKGGGAGLAALIPKGMRAAAVRVNEIVGLAGFVVPGMRVDVLISGNPPGETSLGAVTKTLLQNIEVLSAGQNFQKDEEGKPISVQVVNLLVTPDQAEMLSLAGTQTSIQLVLRNPLDTALAETKGSAVVQLFRGEPGLPAKAKRDHAAANRDSFSKALKAPADAAVLAPVRARVVEILHGAKRTETQFRPAAEVTP